MLRLINLGNPKKLVMDEVYYVPDSVSVLRYGYEKEWVKDYHAEGVSKEMLNLLLSGVGLNNNVYVADHPPMGKILAAIGIFLFGESSPIGWRFSALIAGTLIIVATMLLAHIIFNKKIVTCMAGLFIAIDGFSIAMSRVLHLDVFISLLVLLGFVLFAKFVKSGGVRYFYVSSFFFGLAMGVKWSAAYFFAGAIFLFILFFYKKGILYLIKQITITVLIFLITYLSSWSLWLINYALPKTGNIIDSFILLLNTHVQKYSELSHYNLPHASNSHPWEWILSSHPVLMYIDATSNNTSAITSMPNILLWIFSILAFIYLAVILFKDYNANMYIMLLIVPVLFGYMPWLFYTDRITFQTYMLPVQPFLYIMLSFAIYVIYHTSQSYRKILIIFVGVSIIFSLIMYPLSVGTLMQKNSLPWTIYESWNDANISLGLYDTSQMNEVGYDFWVNKNHRELY